MSGLNLTKAKELETQILGGTPSGSVTFKCYGVDVTVPVNGDAVCDGS